jgi:HTH-type transcriptional regulator/antitoxin HipB
MQTLMELGEAVALRRKELRLHQSELAAHCGLTRETIVRFERGQLTEFGSRKLMAVLAVLGMEMTFTPVGETGTLDELRRERGGEGS